MRFNFKNISDSALADAYNSALVSQRSKLPDSETLRAAAAAIGKGRTIPAAPTGANCMPGRMYGEIRALPVAPPTDPTVTAPDTEHVVLPVRFTTGAVVRRYTFDFGQWAWIAYDEALDISGMDLTRLNNGAPFLNSHRAGDSNDVLGTIVPGSARVDGTDGLADVRFSRRASVAETVQDIIDGILSKVSIGYDTLEETITQRDGNVPLYTATKWVINEVSSVPIAADDMAMFGYRASADVITVDVPTNAKVDTMKIRAARGQSVRVTDGVAELYEDSTATGGDWEVSNGVATLLRANAADGPNVAEAINAERKRVKDVETFCESIGLSATQSRAISALGVGLESSKVKAYELRHQADSATGNGVRDTAIIAEDGTDAALAEGMALAIMHRANPGDKEVRAEFEANISKGGRAGEFAHMRLMEMAEYSVKRAGVPIVRGGVRMSPGKIAAAALYCDAETNARMRGHRGNSGGLTAAMFPEVLGDTANRVLRRMYAAIPVTYPAWCVEGSVKDFRPQKHIQISDAPDLLPVGDGGEIERGTMRDSAESISVKEFARIVSITRETLINDDLGAFGRIPMGLANKARALETRIVYGILTQNANMSDGVPLFHADHNNVGSITGGPGAAGALAEIRQKFRTQTSQSAEDAENGNKLNLLPRFLILPSTLEDNADKILSERLYAATSANVVPENLRRLFAMVVEPELDDTSETEYYVAADSSVSGVDTVMFAYLEGERGLQSDTRVGFEVMGVENRVHMTFGAKALDHRGLLKMPGA